MRAVAPVLIAAVLVTSTAGAGTPPFVKGPYLQELGATGVDLRVEVDPPQSVVVDIGEPGDAGPLSAKRLDSKDKTAFHEVHLGGLEPGHRYAYAVRAGAASQSGTFTTAPRDDSKGSFTFLVYGDNRSDPVAHASVVRAMGQVPSDFLIHTGDFVEDGRDATDWQAFFDVENGILRDRCLFACVGNHELLEKAGDNYLRFFGPTATPGEAPHLYGTFRWGDARFFLLNGQDTFGEGAERAWLDKELAAAENEAGLVWRFAIVHFGYRSAGPHGDNPRLLDAGIDKLLKDKKVDLVVSGHDHIYERGEEKGMRYVVSGGGGAPLYRVKVPLASTRKVEPTYHFVVADVSADKVKLVARRADGSILDACGFGHGAGWDCDPAGARASSTDPAKPGDTPASLPAPAAAQASRCGCGATGAAGSGAPFAGLLALGLLALRRRLR